jgi:aryl-alcohol dehydrogenase-like predicted oxidoreductase
MRYHLFGQRTGLRISELVLGVANFGTGWGYGANLDDSRSIVDAYAEAGGNFIDGANVYQAGQSEAFLGEILAGRRDQFVLATKYSQSVVPNAGVLPTGNSRLAMRISVEASLKRLKTDRIDVFWVHLADGVTPIDEIMRGLDDLVRAGKIVYPGLSNFPAWRAARGATLADLQGWTPLAGLQFEYSLVQRTSEHELIPAGRALGLGLLAWSPLGGGLLSGKYRRGEKGRLEALGGVVFQQENSSQRTAVVDETLAVAQELNVAPAEVAVAWVASKGTLPIIGPRTLEQLQTYIAATEITLSAEHIERLDRVSALEPIFPYSMINAAEYRRQAAGGAIVQIAADAPPVA